MEFHGANTPTGVFFGAPTTRWYIDAHNIFTLLSANAPNEAAGNDLGLTFRATGEGAGPAGDFKLVLGPVWVTWIPLLAGYAPHEFSHL